MRPGDVILVKGDNRNLLDLGIMHFTHSSLVHAAIAVSETEVVEAKFPHVHRIAPPWDTTNSYTITPAYASADAVNTAVQTALGFVGEDYDVVGLAEMLMFEVSTGLNRDAVIAVLRRWSKLPVLWCSELVARCLVAAGMNYVEPSYITTPADLGNFLNCRTDELLPDGITHVQWGAIQSPTFRLVYNQVGQP